MKDTEDMRKFNSAKCKENGETIDELESELEKEHIGKTESFSQMVLLQYHIKTVEHFRCSR